MCPTPSLSGGGPRGNARITMKSGRDPVRSKPRFGADGGSGIFGERHCRPRHWETEPLRQGPAASGPEERQRSHPEGDGAASPLRCFEGRRRFGAQMAGGRLVPWQGRGRRDRAPPVEAQSGHPRVTCPPRRPNSSLPLRAKSAWHRPVASRGPVRAASRRSRSLSRLWVARAGSHCAVTPAASRRPSIALSRCAAMWPASTSAIHSRWTPALPRGLEREGWPEPRRPCLLRGQSPQKPSSHYDTD